MNTDLHTILINGKRHPDVLGLKLLLQVGNKPSTATVTVFPYQQATKGHILQNLPIIDGVLDIPLTILFVSYAREDEAPVLYWVEKLMADGYVCWLDKKQILPGDKWEYKVENAILNTQFALVFLSSESVKKVGYVQREWKLIHKQASLRPNSGRYLIPIKLDDCQVPQEYNEYDWLEIQKPGEYERLLRAFT